MIIVVIKNIIFEWRSRRRNIQMIVVQKQQQQQRTVRIVFNVVDVVQTF
jgi:hypothetical protein